MKKILAVILCVLICVSCFPPALAASSRDFSFETSLAQQLCALGLFQGTGTNEDGADSFDLDRAPSRVEALVMLVRTLGKGAEAEACPRTHPFSDVPAWADGYVSYAYDNGLTSGVSDTLFGTEEVVSAETYLTFMLRALGYSDGDGKEFTWDAPWMLASWCGILPTQVDKTDFLRADVVDVTCAALYAYVKGTQMTLYERLVSENAFSQEQFDAAFTADPFGAFRQLDGRVSAAIAAKEPLGILENNVYAGQCHIIVDVTADGDTVTVTALVCIGSAVIRENNTIGNYGAWIGPWLIRLDARTLECTSCQTVLDLAAQGLSWADWLPEDALAMQDSLIKGAEEVCRLEAQQKLDSGEIGYR